MARNWVAGTKSLGVFKDEVYLQDVKDPGSVGHAVAVFLGQNVSPEDLQDGQGNLSLDKCDTYFQQFHNQLFDILSNNYSHVMLLG